MVVSIAVSALQIAKFFWCLVVTLDAMTVNQLILTTY